VATLNTFFIVDSYIHPR